MLSDGEQGRSTEETDQLSRSTKKMKRVGESGNLEHSATFDEEMEEANLSSPRPVGYRARETSQAQLVLGISYRDSLQRNNPNLVSETRENPMWSADYYWEQLEDDEPPEFDDPTCPTILLTAQEKRILRELWRNALIIRMFDKGIGFLQLKRRLKTKWALKGDFSLIDIGHEYYVTRFTNMDDYEHVMMNGPWMLGDNYVVREWVPNFVPEEDTITRLMAWADAHTENNGSRGDNEDTYSSWMLVRRTNQRRPQRPQNQGDDRERTGTLGRETRTRPEAHPQPNMATNHISHNTAAIQESNIEDIQDGSRFRAPANIDLNVEMETAEAEILGDLQEEREQTVLEVSINDGSNMGLNDNILDKENIPDDSLHEDVIREETRPIVQGPQKRPQAGHDHTMQAQRVAAADRPRRTMQTPSLSTPHHDGLSTPMTTRTAHRPWPPTEVLPEQLTLSKLGPHPGHLLTLGNEIAEEPPEGTAAHLPLMPNGERNNVLERRQTQSGAFVGNTASRVHDAPMNVSTVARTLRHESTQD
ncbi:hypothetical protein Cgig2_026403 [Carnegiea gigantea]|uniref:DUF4283 domain-containing protein n=1 Tax=Carnegiea gigantea TaxID=171969 RepID=A0A9Q1K1A2_9CARY|nr:hypothetical protein Cgig2_026403 [Carnegiea gigantea]